MMSADPPHRIGFMSATPTPAVYRADLPGNRSAFLLAHLLPGDQLIVETSLGARTITSLGLDEAVPWISVYDDQDGLRICRWGTRTSLTGNTPARTRGPVTTAAREVRGGGAAIVRRRLVPYYNRAEWRPFTHELVPAD